MQARRGFALTEALVALVLFSIVMGGAYTFFRSGHVWTARATEQAGALAEMRVALLRIAHEVREGRQLIYPPAGKASQPGLGIIGPRGQVVFFLLVTGAPGAPAAAPYDLVRAPVGAPREVLLRRVTRFLACTEDTGPGAAVRVAHLVLSRALAPPPSTDGLALMTTATVHAPRTSCLAVR